MIQCGKVSDATDIFRITSESPFLYYSPVLDLWKKHCAFNYDATFYDQIIDGCGFEIIRLDALEKSHNLGDSKHRSELCSLFIRENKGKFKINHATPPKSLFRKDLRLTVDNPEDLVLCRAVYKEFREQAPQIPLEKIIIFLDKNPSLSALTYPFTEAGYKTMYL